MSFEMTREKNNKKQNNNIIMRVLLNGIVYRNLFKKTSIENRHNIACLPKRDRDPLQLQDPRISNVLHHPPSLPLIKIHGNSYKLSWQQ